MNITIYMVVAVARGSPSDGERTMVVTGSQLAPTGWRLATSRMHAVIDITATSCPTAVGCLVGPPLLPPVLPQLPAMSEGKGAKGGVG